MKDKRGLRRGKKHQRDDTMLPDPSADTRPVAKDPVAAKKRRLREARKKARNAPATVSKYLLNVAEKRKLYTEKAPKLEKDEDLDHYNRRVDLHSLKAQKVNEISLTEAKRKEKWRQFRLKKAEKLKNKKRQDSDSESEPDDGPLLDEDRTILDLPRRTKKVDFEKPAFGEVAEAPPSRDLKLIAERMLSKRSLVRQTERLLGEKLTDVGIKKVVVPDLPGLHENKDDGEDGEEEENVESSEDDGDRVATRYSNLSLDDFFKGSAKRVEKLKSVVWGPLSAMSVVNMVAESNTSAMMAQFRLADSSIN